MLFSLFARRFRFGENLGDFHTCGDGLAVFFAGFEAGFFVGDVCGLDHVGVVEADDGDVFHAAFGGDDEAQSDLGGRVAFAERIGEVGPDAALRHGRFVHRGEFVRGLAGGGISLRGHRRVATGEKGEGQKRQPNVRKFHDTER